MRRNEFFLILPNTLFFKYFLILAALGLSCGTQNLRSSLWYTGSLVAAWELHVVCGIYFPDQRSNLGPLHWQHRVLTTEPPGRSLLLLLLLNLFSRERLFVTPQTAAQQAPLSLGFSRQEYCSGLPFPFPMHACMHAKSLQSCPTLCDPIDSSPPGSSVHRIL